MFIIIHHFFISKNWFIIRNCYVWISCNHIDLYFHIAVHDINVISEYLPLDMLLS